MDLSNCLLKAVAHSSSSNVSSRTEAWAYLWAGLVRASEESTPLLLPGILVCPLTSDPPLPVLSGQYVVSLPLYISPVPVLVDNQGWESPRPAVSGPGNLWSGTLVGPVKTALRPSVFPSCLSLNAGDISNSRPQAFTLPPLVLGSKPLSPGTAGMSPGPEPLPLALRTWPPVPGLPLG